MSLSSLWESDVESCRISLEEAGHCFSLGELGGEQDSVENKDSDCRGGAALAEE